MSRIFNILLGSAVLLAALGLAFWFVVRTIRRAPDPARMTFNWILTVPLVFLCIMAVPWFGPFGPFLIVFCAVVFSIVWTPSIASSLVSPLTGLFDGGNEPPEPVATYSIAESLLKRGKFADAAREICRQLERFPTDQKGHLLLAETQAEHLKDLAAAAATLNRFCAQPGHPARAVVAALNTLADWQLKHGGDSEAARQSLERIQQLFPDSEFALRAAERIAHLSDSPLGSQERRKFVVAKGVDNIGLSRGHETVKAPEINPKQFAEDLVARLEAHPHDTEAREKLAALYEEHFQRLDLAIEQIETLLAVPNHPHKSMVRWLNMLADMQVRAQAEPRIVQETLQRIIDLDPNLAAANLAKNRQALLHLEFKAQEKSQTVKLGSYENNIGLKRGLPHQL